MTRVALLAKAPRAGYVKTRLSAELGEQAAVDIYRQLGRQVIDQVSVGHTVTVWYAPHDAGDEMRLWLGDHEYLPQPEGNLGGRLAAAFQAHFDRGETPVVAIGADAPGVTAHAITQAATALEAADVVIGPALDGGYYLLALKRPCPSLFEDIPWGTADVLQLTLAACKRRHYTVVELEPLRDLDTAEDWLALRRGRT